ncbi:MAG: hypothetical protein IPN03_14560 [Holophagales bacterium]|nr:hypothetical protein [Holophagales bacterium]
MDAPKGSPTTEVNRKGLIRLIFRYKGLLEAQLSYLVSLPPESETVSLHLPQSPGQGLGLGELSPSLPPAQPPAGSTPPATTAPGDGAGSLSSHAVLLRPRNQDPGTLENSCVSSIDPITNDVELVDAVTPFVRALAE